jgi:hypothetical protein
MVGAAEKRSERRVRGGPDHHQTPWPSVFDLVATSRKRFAERFFKRRTSNAALHQAFFHGRDQSGDAFTSRFVRGFRKITPA